MKINWEDGGGEPLWSNALYVKNVNGLLVEGFRANQEVTQNNVSDILLSDVKNALIQPKSIKEIRVQAEGKHSQNIMISQTGSNLKVINKLQDKQQVKINNQ